MLVIDQVPLSSRLFLGTARYPSLQHLTDSIQASQTAVITIALRRQLPKADGHNPFWEYIRSLPIRLLPNTAGCQTVKEAVTTAHMARELLQTHWIKLEVIGDDQTLQPDPFATVEAAKILIADGFTVFPYTTEDLVVAERLVDAGCRIVMPWGSPIGSGQGLRYQQSLHTLRQRLPDITLIIDAGIGRPSHAVQAMEMGFDAVLVNTAVAQAHDPVMMARAFARAVESGRLGYHAGMMAQQEFAVASTPVVGRPFWHEVT